MGLFHYVFSWEHKCEVCRSIIRSGLDIIIQHEHSDSKGRLIMLNEKINDKNYFLINLYGANKDTGAVRFYQDFFRFFIDLSSDSNVIVETLIHNCITCVFFDTLNVASTY